MDNGGDILQLCRLCLVKDQVNIPIFEEQGDIRQIFLKISSCLPVKVTPDDKLPKKICDGCSCKLDMLYEFWNTTANAEKQLVSWLDQAGLKANTETADQTMSVVAQQVSSKPSETVVKEEAADEIFMEEITFSEKWEEASSSAGPSATITSDEPPPKRARRAAAVRASLNVAAESDDEDDLDTELTKIEDESEDEDDAEVDDPSYVDAPSTSADDQPGPSGVGKDGGDAPAIFQENLYNDTFNIDSINTNNLMQCKYFMDIVNDCKQNSMNDNMLESNVVDHLNESDAELLNLLTAEDDCSAILQNIATNEQFQQLINNDTSFVHDVQMDPYVNKSCEVPVASNVTYPAPEQCFKCDQCNRICKTKKLLKKHFLIHTQEKKYSCEICGKTFRQKYEVTAHLRSHNKPTFQCDICSKMFVHKSHLNTHRRKHLGEYVAFCNDCQMGFVTQTSYKTHRNVHHDNLQLICDICGSKLSTLSALKEHKMTHEPDYGKNRSHVCEVCGKSYLTSRNLKSHMKVHHKIRPYICRICGKSVSSKNILETHIKMHTGVKDLRCEYCDKNFASKEYLTVHQRIHIGEKPFECTICGKRFTQKTSLTVHLRFHTGHKPYKCECGKEFTTKSHLMSHYKTHDIGGVDIEYITHSLH
ncbi:zinc finger protein 260 isoform X6 [Aethina tumida]|uniref:zinc finger protein 260 isoform X6 n=1 Tax=Aethina tumida TaxID=116153 RepID=UPI00214828B7|nr:zinc finger protein 260 isoform X6 [Aethina tumida]